MALGIVPDQSISVSRSHGVGDAFMRRFNRLWLGAGSKVLLTSKELEDASAPMQAGLDKLFSHLHSRDFDEFAEHYAAHPSPVRHRYGLKMLRTHLNMDLTPYLRDSDNPADYVVPRVAAE